ncbi:MAG: hypothetical protein GXY77_10145 [Fibrobacter sp.]|nr:hypothetical protein [Fibrobacter sp.]
MSENDTILIQVLKTSFSLQLQWYRELLDLDRKMMSRLVLSRGDISGIVTGMENKNRLIDMIQMERDKTCTMVGLWEKRKNELSNNDPDRVSFDEILEQIESTIREFLREEDLLKKYIDGIINKNPDSQNVVK